MMRLSNASFLVLAMSFQTPELQSIAALEPASTKSSGSACYASTCNHASAGQELGAGQRVTSRFVSEPKCPWSCHPKIGYSTWDIRHLEWICGTAMLTRFSADWLKDILRPIDPIASMASIKSIPRGCKTKRHKNLKNMENMEKWVKHGKTRHAKRGKLWATLSRMTS